LQIDEVHRITTAQEALWRSLRITADYSVCMRLRKLAYIVDIRSKMENRIRILCDRSYSTLARMTIEWQRFQVTLVALAGQDMRRGSH
jgi:hypothetical protein